MKSQDFPARFVGEFAEIDYDNYGGQVPQVGDVALVGRRDGPHLFIRCACRRLTQIPLGFGKVLWELASREPVSVEPSIRTIHAHFQDRDSTVCHYVIRDGRLCFLADSTTVLEAQS